MCAYVECESNESNSMFIVLEQQVLACSSTYSPYQLEIEFIEHITFYYLRVHILAIFA